ncbi:hypothetical protein SAMN05660909_03698 [Chitinophaga terrae (ex Kim and Jung 2007)]|uniref:Uncharacterized protein n=1 Tax=Chitinophaga terrae (ex Kim and Jung 2007) TaxID=408074 RepID=A0A1H4EI41_9BACT|nr:hypothetical protein [Chitinophaga terrae (ex Kim and Jung 2007)]MDQ0109585.1 BMFP domain-containing protein YqiC [Chitinophaga terrae (ex Kim and Jung 2007)]GEP91611.1 hypothetical protein CTE07_32560 [Chitinophaga terrae (ex Kim and Jung 2007)]SEA83892.1 hypothetical protein SAMN05660909_03698 [Chitinophaga terrae (ex Kim and Jung 2007)]
MRHINPSIHHGFCKKLENIETEPNLVNRQIIFENEIAEALSSDKKQLEDLFYSYQERLKEIDRIRREYFRIQQQARVKLRKQQLRNNTRTK